MPESPIALEAWERLAESYAAQVETKAHNALYKRPATLSLLPSVKGKRVLDAGCGPGVYAELLVEQGAEVTGFDVSPKMVQLAQSRLRGRAQIVLGDFSQPLDFSADSFDIVLSSLALDYVRDWESTFGEFFRVLHRHGHFVLSAHHPADEFFEHHSDGNYFEVEFVDRRFWSFGGQVTVPAYRRSLAAMLDPLFDAGFTLERLLEPRPLDEFKDQDPGDYEKLIRQPGFICFLSRKP